jgi:hypothetical protein
MAKFTITAPDGKNRYEVDAPEGTPYAEAAKFVEKNYQRMTPLPADAKDGDGKTYRFPSDSAAIGFTSQSKGMTGTDVLADMYGGKLQERKELAQMTPDQRVGQIPGLDPRQAALTADNPPRPEPRPLKKQIGDVVAPTVEMLAGLGGAALGTPAGPMGAVYGSGVGYAGARQFLGATGLVDDAGGAGDNMLSGMLGQAGGGAVGNALASAVKAGKPVLQSVGAAFNSAGAAATKAQKILTEALAKDGVSMDTVKAILSKAPPDMLPGTALARAGVVSPTTQALFDNYLSKYAPGSKDAALAAETGLDKKVMSFLAGGSDQTAARQTREASVRNLNKVTEPVKAVELKRANAYNQSGLDERAAIARTNAAQGAEDVRRVGAATERAGQIGTAADSAVTAPEVADRFFKLQDLGNAATDKSAKYALDQGAVARSAEAAAQSLKASGLRPLKTDSILAGVDRVLADVTKAGNVEMPPILNEVKSLIRQWTNANGVIDAVALDAIRKNAVSSIVAKMNVDPKASSQVAASSLKSLQPLIEDAIEAAGGRGYKQYLRDYSTKRAVVKSRPELAAQAMKMFEKNPQEFIDLVRGNNPEAIEAVFGPGNIDIVKQMGEKAMKAMQGVADNTGARMAKDTQILAGQQAMKETLMANKLEAQLPNLMNAKVSVINKMLRGMTGNVDSKTAEILTRGAQSGDRIEKILAQLPESKVDRVIQLLDGQVFKTSAAAGIREYTK